MHLGAAHQWKHNTPQLCVAACEHCHAFVGGAHSCKCCTPAAICMASPTACWNILVPQVLPK